MKVRFVGILLYVVYFGLIWASCEPEIIEFYNKGNEFFKSSEWDSAIVYYSKAVDLGACDWRVFYNLGNSFYRDGNIASALLWYERARILAPREEHILKNIEFVRSQLQDRIEQLYSGSLLGILMKIPSSFSYIELWWMLLFTSALATFFSAFWIVIRKFAHMSIILWCLFLLVLGVWFFKHSMIFEKNPAIIVEAKVDVMSAPSENSELLFTIHSGTKVGILEERDDWYKIILENGHSGWLPANTVEEVWLLRKMNI